MEKRLISFEAFLKMERDQFERSAKYAQKHDMPKYQDYCEGVAAAYQMARVWLHVMLLPDRVESGDILTAKIALGLKKGGSRDLVNSVNNNDNNS